MSGKFTVNIIGGGLAGSEAAFQLAKRGIQVRLFEMRPRRKTPAHKTSDLAELVCSNTFKSTLDTSAPGVFKSELSLLGSVVIDSASNARVPAGTALAVDRKVFSKNVEQALLEIGNIDRITAFVESPDDLPKADATIIATGPLTQGKLAEFIHSLSGGYGLYFYDAIAPVIAADSINCDIAFSASRYGKGGNDYLNCPMNKEEYERFIRELLNGEKLDFQDFEEAKYFQGCQPIEAIAESGENSLRFGPMKPVGLDDPRTGRRPWAVVQLRIDNISRSAYNMVGFQTKLKYGEQSRIFKLIPGLEKAEFLRLGSMHRNTYICSPKFLDKNLNVKNKPDTYLAGQITGVEGYTESSALGLLVAMSIWSRAENKMFKLPPKESMLGSLCHYLFHSKPEEFQPINVHWGIIDKSKFSIQKAKNLRTKKEIKAFENLQVRKQALENIQSWKEQLDW